MNSCGAECKVCSRGASPVRIPCELQCFLHKNVTELKARPASAADAAEM